MFKMLLLVPSFISQVSATMYFHHCSLVTGPACFFCIHKEYYVCSNKQEMFSWYSFILIAAPKQHQTISIQQRNTQVTFQGCLRMSIALHCRSRGQWNHSIRTVYTQHSCRVDSPQLGTKALRRSRTFLLYIHTGSSLHKKKNVRLMSDFKKFQHSM